MDNVHAHLVLLASLAFDPKGPNDPKSPPCIFAEMCEDEHVSTAAKVDQTEAVVTQLLVSTLFLTTKHTWNLKGWTRREDTGRGGNGIDLPEIDIYNYIQQVRFAVFTWMGEAAEHYPRKFQTVLNTVNREVANGDDRDLQWGCIRSENPDLKENLGRYGIDTSSKSADGRVTSIVSGTSVVELNFQTMQMIVKSNVVSALDSSTASHWLVVQTLQRMSKDENNENPFGIHAYK